MHIELTKKQVSPSLVVQYFSKMKGEKRTAPLTSPPGIDLLVSWLGAFLAIGSAAVLSMVFNVPILVASFGASSVLIYGVPDAPFSQPRNVIFGHIISASVGVCVYLVLGLTWWSAGLATSLAIVLMLITKTIHPPAGATALITVLTKATLIYILAPITLGATLLVFIGLLINNLSPNRKYPKYWV